VPRYLVATYVPRTDAGCAVQQRKLTDGMSITRGLRLFVVLVLVLSVGAATSHGADTNSPRDPSPDRPARVVVSVRDGGFHWTDAGVGAAATLATTLLALGLVLALRPDRTGNDNHQALS
jgi:hypothetical protein